MASITLTLKPLVAAMRAAGLFTVQQPAPWVVAPWELHRAEAQFPWRFVR